MIYVCSNANKKKRNYTEQLKDKVCPCKYFHVIVKYTSFYSFMIHSPRNKANKNKTKQKKKHTHTSVGNITFKRLIFSK